jgi:hypothetical protein
MFSTWRALVVPGDVHRVNVALEVDGDTVDVPLYVSYNPTNDILYAFGTFIAGTHRYHVDVTDDGTVTDLAVYEAEVNPGTIVVKLDCIYVTLA